MEDALESRTQWEQSLGTEMVEMVSVPEGVMTNPANSSSVTKLLRQRQTVRKPINNLNDTLRLEHESSSFIPHHCTAPAPKSLFPYLKPSSTRWWRQTDWAGGCETYVHVWNGKALSESYGRRNVGRIPNWFWVRERRIKERTLS